jgi:hypothetical protein
MGDGRRLRAARAIGWAVALAPLMLGGCAGTAGSGSEASPASAPPVPSEIPDAALLAPAELGAGWRATPVPDGSSRSSASPAAGPAASVPASSRSAPAWPWALPQCVLYDPAEYPAQQHRVAVRQRAYVRAGGRAVTVIVERFAAGWGARSTEDVRRVLETCMRYEYSDRVVEFLDSHVVTAEDFAGDESLLVESTRIAPPGPTRTHHTAVVRVGDLVVTVAGARVPAEDVRRLATLLVGRL